MRDDERLELLGRALVDEAVVARFWGLTRTTDTACGRCWVGAITGRGHGRFWVARSADGHNVAIIAHRFAAALRHGLGVLLDPTIQVTHTCDETTCVSVGDGHVILGTAQSNTQEWRRRSQQIGSPLRDTRGARGRALAARAAALQGQSVKSALAAGLPEIDRFQGMLPGLGGAELADSRPVDPAAGRRFGLDRSGRRD